MTVPKERNLVPGFSFQTGECPEASDILPFTNSSPFIIIELTLTPWYILDNMPLYQTQLIQQFY
jgi:hypothetical protein